ncbi:MAG: Sulfatase protein, partial [uncultured bacterium]
MEHKYSINYVYFGILFVLLSLFVASNMSQKNALAGSYFFFFLYALGQVTLEIILFIVVGELIRQFFTKALFFFFIGLTFLALVVHFFDFLIERILDLSVWRALQIFVLDENIENFFYLLDASGISLWIWLLFFVLLSSVPFIGIFFYKMTLLIVQKKPLQLESATLLQAAICLPFALFFWDFSASATIHPDTYTAFTTSLPWKTTFLEPEKRRIHLLNPLANPLDEKGVALAIQEDSTNLRYKPNIYLFIVESLRADAICDEVAPNVQQFKEHSAHFVHAISGANATHISWFSIFHSQFPYHWKHMQERKWSMGSPALNLLKHWGYQVRLYTSAQLGYYKMQDLLFGKDLHLLNAKQEFFHTSTRTAADTDALALAALKKDLLENPELQSGQVFIIFWDCTHFDYSWPKNWTPKFTPYTQKFVYSHALHSKKAIQSMKNKYHNSIHYMDSLFGSFLEFLPDKERAIVAFTGDHGEEFFEN